MADYCSNFIVFRSSEKDSLQQFLDTLNGLFAESKTKYTDLLLKYDINYSEPLDDNTLYSDDCFFYCKGYFDYCDNDISYNENCKEYYFYAYSYTAWKPQTEVLDLLLKKIPGEIMYYIASEEPGDNLFINTDEERQYINYNYYVDFNYRMISFTESFERLDSCYKLLFDEIGWKYTNLKKAKKRFRKFLKKEKNGKYELHFVLRKYTCE